MGEYEYVINHNKWAYLETHMLQELIMRHNDTVHEKQEQHISHYKRVIISAV